MKKEADAKSNLDRSTEMRAEYQFDYRKAKPNRFASRTDKKRIVVALEPDVAGVFTTPEAVNEVLRALIHTMPKTTRRRART